MTYILTWLFIMTAVAAGVFVGEMLVDKIRWSWPCDD